MLPGNLASPKKLGLHEEKSISRKVPMVVSNEAKERDTMNAKETIADLLRDAEHIARANNFVILAYLIGMALEYVENEITPRETKVG